MERPEICTLSLHDALPIFGAADKGAELAELERQLAGAAGGAQARVAAIGLGREDVIGQQVIERVEDFGNAQVLDLKGGGDRKSTRLNSSHVEISYAVFCLK